MDRIVLIFERSYFYQNHLKQFGISKMQQKGYSVELWSLAEWTFGWKERKTLKNQLENCILINDRSSFECQLRRVQSDRVVFLIYPYHAYGEISAYIRKRIKENKFYFLNLTESPCVSSENSCLPVDSKILFYCQEIGQIFKFVIRLLIYIVFYIVNRKRRKKIGEKIKLHIIKHILPYKYKSTYNIITTKMTYHTFPMHLEQNSKRNIIANSSDYSTYLENLYQKRYIEGKYIVFIDQGITQYLVLPGERKPINDEKIYWLELNRFLDIVERNFNCKVIIAVHPKAKYVNGEYGNRQLIYGETVNLIKNAEKVICMFSTAINYIVLFKKSFIQISSDELMQGGFSKMFLGLYKNYINEFDHKILNISKSEYSISDYICHYDEEKYKKYSERYIIDRNGEKEKMLVDILIEKIQEIFGNY